MLLFKTGVFFSLIKTDLTRYSGALKMHPVFAGGGGGRLLIGPIPQHLQESSMSTVTHSVHCDAFCFPDQKVLAKHLLCVLLKTNWIGAHGLDKCCLIDGMERLS